MATKKFYLTTAIPYVNAKPHIGHALEYVIADAIHGRKLMQKAIGVKAVYALEFLSERFDKFPKEEQVKVIIHELMHIPFSFGGGFKHHNHVTERNVNICYKEYKRIIENKRGADEKSWF